GQRRRMARQCVWLVMAAAATLSQGLPKVDGGKIFFPESPAPEELITAAEEPITAAEEPITAADTEFRENRGLWESDLFFLQKLSGLFGGENEQQPQRRKTLAHSNLRPELLPPQMLYTHRRTGTNAPGHHNQVRKGIKKPPWPQRLSSNQGSHALRTPLQNSPGLKPFRQVIQITAPPRYEIPPPLDDPGQHSQNHLGPLRLPPPPPLPPKSAFSNTPVQHLGNFPYQFVKPEDQGAHNNDIIPQYFSSAAPSRVDISPPRAAPPHPNALRPPQSLPNIPKTPLSSHPNIPKTPPPSHLNIPKTPPPFHSNIPRPPPPHSSHPRPPTSDTNSLRNTPPPPSQNPSRLPPPPPKPLKSKKPTLLGSFTNLTPGVFGNAQPPHKHPRPAPQPQRVFFPPNPNPSQNDIRPSLEFKPSPQEGKTAADAFQPVFVASPFMDDLGDDVMKPMMVKALSTTTTTSRPQLQDFF
ncbi:hypothetical protein OTU49_006531, partial [Cherax quadricarinatus]